MAKFNVGDKVRVIGGLTKDSNDQGVCINGSMERMSREGVTLTISYVTSRGDYFVKENDWSWSSGMLELLEPVKEIDAKEISKGLCEIADYKYDSKTGETYIKWTDKTQTTVRPTQGTAPDQYVGFVTAFAKKAAGNTSRINNLFDKWAFKKPILDMKAEAKRIGEEIETKRIIAKRKAKREKWLIRKEALRIKREYEAKKLANEKYGVPMNELSK